MRQQQQLKFIWPMLMVMSDGGQAAVLPTHHGHGVNDDRQAAALSDTGHSAMVSMMTIKEIC